MSENLDPRESEVARPQEENRGGPFTRRMSRRGFLRGAGALGAGLGAAALVGCGPDGRPLEPQPPTPTPTPEPSPMPTVEGFPGLPLPDSVLMQASIGPYAKAMDLSPETVRVAYREFKDYQDNPFVIGLDSATNIPLILADKVNGTTWRWREATLGILGNKTNIRIGAGWGGSGTPEDLNRIDAAIKKEFNFMGIYAGMNNLQPQEGVFKLDFFGRLVDKAYNNNMPIFIYPLVYHLGSPEWFGKLPRERMIEAMNGQIKAVMGEVKKRKTVDKPIYKVVNEAYDKNNPLMRVIGPEYVDIAFQTARETDPNAILLYNDYDNHTTNHAVFGNKYQRTKEIADRLKAKGLIDAIGVEMYVDGSNPPDPEDIVKTLPKYGLPVVVTEFMVNMKNVSLSQPDRFIKQAELFEQMTSAAFRSGVCNTFLDFQLGDTFSVWETPGRELSSPIADPTPYYDDLTPKPALYYQRRGFLPPA